MTRYLAAVLLAGAVFVADSFGQEPKLRGTLKGHTDAVSSVAFSPDNRMVVSGSLDGTVKLWEVATGKERAILQSHTARMTSLAFSAEGKTLASGDYDWTIKLWELATGKERVTLRASCN